MRAGARTAPAVSAQKCQNWWLDIRKLRHHQNFSDCLFLLLLELKLADLNKEVVLCH